MASSIVELDPLIKWTLAIIAGGGAAGLVQSLTTITRGASSITTAGFGNPIVTTAETSAAVGISIMALFFPLVIGILVLLLLVWAGNKVYKKLFNSSKVLKICNVL